jgi:uncharacterized membrane protein
VKPYNPSIFLLILGLLTGFVALGIAVYLATIDQLHAAVDVTTATAALVFLMYMYTHEETR